MTSDILSLKEIDAIVRRTENTVRDVGSRTYISDLILRLAKSHRALIMAYRDLRREHKVQPATHVLNSMREFAQRVLDSESYGYEEELARLRKQNAGLTQKCHALIKETRRLEARLQTERRINAVTGTPVVVHPDPYAVQKDPDDPGVLLEAELRLTGALAGVVARQSVSEPPTDELDESDEQRSGSTGAARPLPTTKHSSQLWKKNDKGARNRQRYEMDKTVRRVRESGDETTDELLRMLGV